MNIIRRLNNDYLFFAKNKMVIKPNIRAAVFVNLFYIEDVQYYLDFLNQVDSNIDIYIFSSSQQLLDRIKKIQNRDYYLILKNNIGRDMSALLVETAKYVKNYEVFCFSHDKRARNQSDYKDCKFWTENLWENSLGSSSYIMQILEQFSIDSSIGIIAPPEPIGEVCYYGSANNFWGNGNFDNVKKLEHKLGIKETITEESQPIFLGNVFWARTSSLDKLWKVGWKYDDFPEEPMPDDGTISHALERIIGYVAKDAGYKVLTAMNTDYAGKYIQMLFDNNSILSRYIQQNADIIPTIINVSTQMVREASFSQFCDNHSYIYIYGAGKKGVRMLGELLRRSITPCGFLVTNVEDAGISIYGIPVIAFRDLHVNSTCGVIVSVSKKNQNDIVNYINEKVDYICVD